MRSIRKIASTPIKWAFKKVLHQTILRFPGGDAHSPIACVYCPELCRFSCPTAVVSGNDAVTPCNKMGLTYKAEKWPEQTLSDQPFWPLYDCTGCGRCTQYCLYGMPVANQLFEARKKWKWEVAEKAASKLNDESDQVGDLADELGDEISSQKRLHNFLKNKNDLPLEAREPRSVFFLRQQGRAAIWAGSSKLNRKLSEQAQKKLSGKTWLVHESVWLNRRLSQADEVTLWIKQAQGQGIQLQVPFANGLDCTDCGGEGAYSDLFPEQAKQMANEIWDRDRNQVDGILCFSQRCVNHFKKSLGSNIPIIGFEDLWN